MLLQGWLAVKILCRSNLLVLDPQAGLSVKRLSVHATPTPLSPVCFLLTPPTAEGNIWKFPWDVPKHRLACPRNQPAALPQSNLWTVALWAQTWCSKLFSYNFLLYPFVSEYCDGDFFLPNTGGTFQTPLYPGQYPPDLQCIWKIQAAENDKIILRFRWETSTSYSADIDMLISATLPCTSDMHV